ncbi:MAG: PEP-utilizing enzyme [Patescibacteria group bacterium]|nr:PEP-utilizing enzyme [Patescibacteria group bacterium]
MPLSRIKSIEFWAREYRMPLFWLTDPRHFIPGQGFLFLAKNNVTHCYYVNQRIKKEQESGYRYFSKSENFKKFIEKSDELVTEMKRAEKEFKKYDLKSLSNKAFYEAFNTLVALICRFSGLYTKTEAAKLQKFENRNNSELKKSFLEVGQARFKLRKAVESFFPLVLHDVLKENVRRYGIKPGDWFFYTHSETKNLFKGKLVNSKKIAQRQKGYALLNLNGHNELLVDQDFKQAWKLVKSMTKTGKELKGLPAQPGIVKGKAELIRHNVRDLMAKVKKFKAGNILVTEMTTPSTILACKKASAIVTDEGGVLCHAAIISRELKKPCVVGTKQATQTIKSGDLIEVDANRGIVKLLR